MRKVGMTLTEIIAIIKGLQGENVDMEVNLGRKKIEKYQGIIENIYPSVFTVNVHIPTGKGLVSYSYNDVLCGDVKISGQK